MGILDQLIDDIGDNKKKLTDLLDQTLKKREHFLTEVKKLYADVERWLAPLIKSIVQDPVKKPATTTLTDAAGLYEAPLLSLDSEKFTLRLSPLDWHVYSADGKALLVIGERERTLLLRDDGWYIAEEQGENYVYKKVNRKNLTELIEMAQKNLKKQKESEN